MAALALASDLKAAAPRVRLSARSGSIGGGFDKAKLCGLDGLEIGCGGAKETLSIATPDAIKSTREQAEASGVAVSSLSMDLLNGRPLFSDQQAPMWVEQVIGATKELGGTGILVPFFGKANLRKGRDLKADAVDSLVGRLKDLAPKAEKAAVSLGIECTLSAKQYLHILDRVGSEAVSAYYDVGNSTFAGLDVPADLRALKGRMCLIHFKAGRDYLGEGRVKMEPIAEALNAIDFEGWVVLETSCPSKDRAADGKRNADYVRKLLKL
jgi:sugar phosphate isomerase/epimerase